MVDSLVGKTKLFGGSLDTIGTGKSDITIKTKGKVKILMGGKFIDLIKDGKINVDTDLVSVVKSEGDIGNSNGIYVVSGETPSVWVVAGRSKINILGEVGNTYVSFLGKLATTSELKKTALMNIGLLYETLSDVNSDSLKNGVIYVESEKKLYTILDGTLSEFEISIPNPFSKLFVIAKSDSLKGALLIKGSGKENSLAFDRLYIYNTLEGESILDSLGNFIITTYGDELVKFLQGLTKFSGKVVSDRFESSGASATDGFRLYTELGKSVLEVDQIIERDHISDPTALKFFYPEYWLYLNNVVSSANYYEESYVGGDIPEGSEIIGGNTLRYFNKFVLSLAQANEFQVGDILFLYYREEYQSGNETLVNIARIKLKILSVLSNLAVLALSSILDSNRELLPKLLGEVIYLGQRTNTQFPIRIKDNNIDIANYVDLSDSTDPIPVLDPPIIESRFGDLSSVPTLSSLPDDRKRGGIYSNNAVLKNPFIIGESQEDLPKYSDDLNSILNSLSLDQELDVVIPPIAYIKKLISAVIPSGTIVMWSGATIPEGWAICDGSNGTPNLIGKFIKAGATAAITGGSNSVTLTVANMPSHTHELSNTSIKTSENGSHFHLIDISSVSVGPGENSIASITGITGTRTGYSGKHTHSVDLSSVTLSEVGEGLAFDILPEYYTLLYIMKL